MKRAFAVITLLTAVLAMGAVAVYADNYQESVATAQDGGTLISNDGQLIWTTTGGGGGSHDIFVRYYLFGADNLPARPANTIWVGQPFTLYYIDRTNNAPVSLDQPATLVVHYNPADLGGRSESTLRLVHYTDHWADLPSTVDTTNDTVTAQSTSPGNFGLLANDNLPAVPAPAPTAAPAPAPAAAPVPAPAPIPAPATPTGSVISGTVFYDKNGNGVMDDGDFPIDGAGVALTASGNWYQFTRTGADGHYVFTGLGNGSYSANVIVGSEWAFTTPFAVSGIKVTGQAGSVGSANFGMWYKLP